MRGHRSRLRENDDLPLWRVPAVKKKPPFSNVVILGNGLKVVYIR